MSAPDKATVYEAVSDAVREVVEWPYPSLILREVHEAVAENVWTPMPPGSHVLIERKDRGCDVVAIRWDGDLTHFLNERGEPGVLSDTVTLVVGGAR